MIELELIGYVMSLDEISEYLPKLDDSKVEDCINKGLLMLNAQEQFENDGDFRQWVREEAGEQDGAMTVDQLMNEARLCVGVICTEDMTFSELQELLYRKGRIPGIEPAL